MIKLSDHDKRVLSSVGHGAYGKEFIQILTKAKDQLCSLEGIERSTGDYGQQVEGRLLFKDFALELIELMQFEKRPKRDPAGMNAGDYE